MSASPKPQKTVGDSNLGNTLALKQHTATMSALLSHVKSNMAKDAISRRPEPSCWLLPVEPAPEPLPEHPRLEGRVVKASAGESGESACFMQ
jgi:hypothetical protein